MAQPIGIQHVVALNELFAKNQLPAKVHLHDACGGQTLSLELPANKSDALLAQIQEMCRAYFADNYIRIVFDELTGTTFRSV